MRKRRRLVERQPDEGILEWVLTFATVYGGLVLVGFFALVVVAILVSTIIGAVRS